MARTHRAPIVKPTWPHDRATEPIPIVPKFKGVRSGLLQAHGSMLIKHLSTYHTKLPTCDRRCPLDTVCIVKPSS
jgi:hypothetical protein